MLGADEHREDDFACRARRLRLPRSGGACVGFTFSFHLFGVSVRPSRSAFLAPPFLSQLCSPRIRSRPTPSSPFPRIKHNQPSPSWYSFPCSPSCNPLPLLGFRPQSLFPLRTLQHSNLQTLTHSNAQSQYLLTSFLPFSWPLFSCAYALFHVPYPVSSLFASLTKTGGCIPTIPILEPLQPAAPPTLSLLWHARPSQVIMSPHTPRPRTNFHV